MGASDKCLLGKSGGYPPEYFGKFQYSEAILGDYWDPHLEQYTYMYIVGVSIQ